MLRPVDPVYPIRKDQYKHKSLILTYDMKDTILRERNNGTTWKSIAVKLGVSPKWLRQQAREMNMYTGRIYNRSNGMRSLIAVGMCATAMACSNVPNIDTPQAKMVAARSLYIGAAASFNVYAMQPWCDQPDAPKPPLCADKSTVIEGANASRAAILALDSADAVIAAKGVPDMTTTMTLVERFNSFVKKISGAL